MDYHKLFTIYKMAGLLLLLTAATNVTEAQSSLRPTVHKEQVSRGIHFTLKGDSRVEVPAYKSQVDSAIIIAETVFNSDTFQNRMQQLSFKHSSYCKDRTSCQKNEKDDKTRITGKQVLADLFRDQNVSMSLFVDSLGDVLGCTCPNAYAITMYYSNIMEDMKDDTIPASYKLAVNLCHEYMHQVGYCHIYGKLKERNGLPDPSYMYQDVTYTVGWEAYYILKDWYAHGHKINIL